MQEHLLADSHDMSGAGVYFKHFYSEYAVAVKNTHIKPVSEALNFTKSIIVT